VRRRCEDQIGPCSASQACSARLRLDDEHLQEGRGVQVPDHPPASAIGPQLIEPVWYSLGAGCGRARLATDRRACSTRPAATSPAEPAAADGSTSTATRRPRSMTPPLSPRSTRSTRRRGVLLQLPHPDRLHVRQT